VTSANMTKFATLLPWAGKSSRVTQVFLFLAELPLNHEGSVTQESKTSFSS